MKYQKRPDLVEADHFFDGHRLPPYVNYGSPDPGDTHLHDLHWVQTPTGPHVVKHGDVILTHADGTRTVMKPDEFTDAYTKDHEYRDA